MNNQNNKKNTYVTPNRISSTDKNKQNALSILLILFYLTCFGFIIVGVGYWYFDNQKFNLSDKDVVMIKNDKYKIGIYGKTEKKNESFTYKSSNPEIVTIDSTGTIYSKSEGEATVTVKSKYSNKKENINIIVQGESIYSVEFENDNITINLKEHVNLKPIVNNNPELKSFYTWKSENDKVVSVSSSGEIVGESPGTTYVHATVKGTKKEARIKINVTGQTLFSDTTVQNTNEETDNNYSNIKDDANDTGFEGAINNYVAVINVTINSEKEELIVEDTIQLHAVVSPDDATNKEVMWDTSDESVAKVDKNGNVTALREGKVDISVKTIDGNKTSFITLNIKNKGSNNKITLSKSELELAISQSETVSAEVLDGQSVKWTSSDEEIVSVDSNGTIVGKKEGKATIICTTADNQTSSSIAVTVTGIIKVNPNIKIENITPNRSSIQLDKDRSYDLKVSIKPADATNKKLEYKSTNDSILTVDENGIITGKNYGTADIKISTTDDSGRVASVRVVVIPAVGTINISKKKYSPYITNIENYVRTTYSKHMQNFAIQNVGTKNEIIYFSGVTSGCYTAKTLTNEQKADLNRTFIIKIPKSEIKKTTKNRTIMWLKNSGHAQSFDVEKDGTIWTNALGKEPRYSGGKWWGGHNGIMELKFKSNEFDSNFSSLVTLRAKDSSGKTYTEPEASVDEDNNLIAIRSNDKVFVYDLAVAKTGKLKLLYSFKISAANSYRQGHDIYGGYFYQLSGQPGGIMRIDVYNMLGEKEYTKEFYIKNASQAKNRNEEAEGLKIYNEKIYIGHTHKKGDGTIFDIGVFK